VTVSGIRILAPAKVNLRLVVLGRETTGYHALETIFCGLSLADTVEVERAPDAGVLLECEGGVDTGPPDLNLAVRAARIYYAELGAEPSIRIRLVKRIPSAAGLGGGSSDAAATLRAIDALHGSALGASNLLRLGAALGSDVPFFLAGTPLALAWGRGERLLALPPPPVRPVLIAHPGIDLPTPEVFRRFAELRGLEHVPDSVELDSGSITTWPGLVRLARNDLEIAARERIPAFHEALEHLREAGAGIALLAGSGSSLFGVFDEEQSMSAAEAKLHALGFRTWRATTLPAWPDPVALVASGIDPAVRTG
jgi:4-diphosphocytidyl-2-C-methyl-D-erythritol kinase